MVQELHRRGFEKLRIIPSMSPSGMNWRCRFVAETKEISFSATNWINNHEFKFREADVQLTVNEWADLFLVENQKFLKQCKGINEEYVHWYTDMLESLNETELPYEFADWSIPKGFWKTTKGNKIKMLPSDENDI